MRKKEMYCTLDTETFGGAAKPKGIYHLGGFIHDRKGKVVAGFNFVIAEFYDEIGKDSYAKKNFNAYEKMVSDGVVTIIPTEEKAIEIVNDLCNFYNVKYLMAFNSGFDFLKTACKSLLEEREFIDLYLMAVETLGKRKGYAKFCVSNELKSKSGKNLATSAESFFAFITGNAKYSEEHTALEDAKIEMEIFCKCIATHLKFTKNCHFYDHPSKWDLLPKAI